MALRVLLPALLVTAAVQRACSAARSTVVDTSIADLSVADLSDLLGTFAQAPSDGKLQPSRRPAPVAALQPGRLPSFAGAFRPPSLEVLQPGRLPSSPAGPTAFLRPFSQGARCPTSQDCVSIRSCPAYRTREDILRNRPTLCGFSGRVPRICCDREAPPSGSVLPLQCGEGRVELPLSRRLELSSARRVGLLPAQIRRQRRQALAGRRRKPPPNGRFTEMVAVNREILTTPRPVIGGDPVDLVILRPGGRQVHRWPWMVLFGRWTDAGLGDWFCGGTLITAQHVLTAAHCLRAEEAGAVGARIADHDLRLRSEVAHQERNVSRIVRHPQYVGAQNDLAVVRLAEPVQLTESVQPICLPPAGAEHIGQDADVAGWGLLEFNGDAADVLQEAPLRVTDPAECEAAYRRVPQFERRFPGGFQGTKVCAESRDGEPRDACRGDSGGPLMALSPGGRYQLLGVVSTGVGCGSPQFPGLYTKVSAYIDWIVSQLN